MNLYHLRYFVTLAHLEHYTKAAELLSITQPSLSHAISSLEKELGIKLFEKEGRNVVLTKYGQAFLKDVEKSLNVLDSSINRLRMTGNGEGLIDIGLLRSLSISLVPGLVRGFLDAHPDRQIDFRFHNSTGFTPDIIAGLKDRKYDIAFCSMMDGEPSVEFTPIARETLVLIVPKGHPLEGSENLRLSAALDYPLIGFSRKAGLRPVIDRLFEECGGAKPVYAYEVDEDHTAAGLVSANFGIAVVPDMTMLKYMPVDVIPISGPGWERIFYMCTLKQVYQAPAVLEFKKYAREHAAL